MDFLEKHSSEFHKHAVDRSLVGSAPFFQLLARLRLHSDKHQRDHWWDQCCPLAVPFISFRQLVGASTLIRTTRSTSPARGAPGTKRSGAFRGASGGADSSIARSGARTMPQFCQQQRGNQIPCTPRIQCGICGKWRLLSYDAFCAAQYSPEWTCAQLGCDIHSSICFRAVSNSLALKDGAIWAHIPDDVLIRHEVSSAAAPACGAASHTSHVQMWLLCACASAASKQDDLCNQSSHPLLRLSRPGGDCGTPQTKREQRGTMYAARGCVW